MSLQATYGDYWRVFVECLDLDTLRSWYRIFQSDSGLTEEEKEALKALSILRAERIKATRVWITI